MPSKSKMKSNKASKGAKPSISEISGGRTRSEKISQEEGVFDDEEEEQNANDGDDGNGQDEDEDDDAPEEESNMNAKRGVDQRERELKSQRESAALKRKRASEAKERRALELKKAKIEKEQAEKEQEEQRLREQIEAGVDEEGAELDGDGGVDLVDQNEDDEEEDDEDDEEDDEEDEEGEGETQLYDIEEDDLDADLDEDDDDSEASNTGTTNKTASNHLDPSLFKTVFSDKTLQPKSILRSKGSESSPFEKLKAAQDAKRLMDRNKKKEGKKLARGRDGEGIKRLKDGRTLVRALNSDKKKSIDVGSSIVITPQPPQALDPTVSLPNARARAFKKRSLGLDLKSNSKDLTNAKSSGPKKVKKTEDDPLGLQDPAFLPGGEFYKGGNGDGDSSGKRKRGGNGGLKLGGRRGEGGRKESAARTGFGSRIGKPALGFSASMA